MSPMEQFPTRGYCVDLRVQVLTLPALKALAHDLAAWGMNTLVIEYEGTYPYERHGTLSNRYAYDRRELRGFLSLCDGLGLSVIPLQQSFGHVEYILRHERYAHLREERADVSQLCPLKSRAARTLLTELLTDMASLHSSEYMHVGGDETYLLGHGPRYRVRVHGLGRLGRRENTQHGGPHHRHPPGWTPPLLRLQGRGDRRVHDQAGRVVPRRVPRVRWRQAPLSPRRRHL